MFGLGYFNLCRHLFLRLGLLHLFVFPLLCTQLFLSLFFFALAIVFSQVTVLAKALRIVELVGVLTCPGFLRPAYPVIATHAHLLCIVATSVVRATENLVLEMGIAIVSFKT